MFSFCNELHKIYQEDYCKYLDLDQGWDNYKLGAIKSGYNSKLSNLWLFKSSTSSNQTFVIVPSLFNSPAILFLNRKQNMLNHLVMFTYLNGKKPKTL